MVSGAVACLLLFPSLPIACCPLRRVGGHQRLPLLLPITIHLSEETTSTFLGAIEVYFYIGVAISEPRSGFSFPSILLLPGAQRFLNDSTHTRRSCLSANPSRSCQSCLTVHRAQFEIDFSSIKHIKLLTHKGTVQFNILFLFFPLGEGSVPNIKLWDFPADKC